YFHPGQFRPGTPDGEKLIAHELAHTLQTRRRALAPDSPNQVHSAEALERNANDLVAGRISQPLSAPAGAALPQQFSDEPWYMEVRRLAVLQRYRQLLHQLQSGLETGALLAPAERIRPHDRIQNMLTGRIVSRAERNAIVGRLVLNLALLITQLEAGAAPGSWDEPIVEGYNLSTADVHGEGDSTITDAVTYYAHWSHDHGHPFAEVHDEEAYIFGLLSGAPPLPTASSPTVQEGQIDRHQPAETSSASPGRHAFEGGHAPVAHIVVEDPEHAPLTYHPAVGGTVPVRGYLADVYLDSDRHEHYYLYRGRRIYLPGFH
ncbi:MAG TPA: DUF4157 domain-containing protein, partial [Opitutaceae bacterium]|nr:DUF4157 domain-containing protein [Opitutaceae bacterium]